MEFRFRAVDDSPSQHFGPSAGEGRESRYFPSPAGEGRASQYFPFPAGDRGASPYSSSLAGDSFFSDQAFRAGYLGDSRRPAGHLRDASLVAREALRRELEKERIREEILAREAVRKRELEEEVRRELALERELALRRKIASDAYAFPPPQPPLRFERNERRVPSPLLAESSRFEESYSFPRPRPMNVGPFGRYSVEHQPELTFSKVNSDHEFNKKPTDFPARPAPNFTASGTKRKPVVSLGASGNERASLSTEKKVEKEWSCALCKVSATSNQGLNDHFRGKKHQAMVAELKGSKNSGGDVSKGKGSAAPVSKKAENPSSSSKFSTASVTFNSNNLRKVRQKKKLKTEISGGRNKVKVTLWCEHCNVRCFSENVMATHYEGKKHKARMEELQAGQGGEGGQPDGAVKKGEEVGGEVRTKK